MKNNLLKGSALGGGVGDLILAGLIVGGIALGIIEIYESIEYSRFRTNFVDVKPSDELRVPEVKASYSEAGCNIDSIKKINLFMTFTDAVHEKDQTIVSLKYGTDNVGNVNLPRNLNDPGAVVCHLAQTVEENKFQPGTYTVKADLLPTPQ